MTINTSLLSDEKRYTSKKIVTIEMTHNMLMDDLLKQLTTIKQKQTNNFDIITVNAYLDFNNEPNIAVIGYALETDTQYKKRLKAVADIKTKSAKQVEEEERKQLALLKQKYETR